ncbi:hypothetical protein ABBQ32_012020 [Trebouxia sp. C0010 RCD-2024]
MQLGICPLELSATLLCRSTGESANVQPAQTDPLELWQQLSSESSSCNEGLQLEELQVQLLQSRQQLHTKEAEVVSMTVELVSLHSQLEAAKVPQQAELSLLEQLDSTRQANEALSAELEQSKTAFQGLKSQLLTAEAALCDQAASLVDFRNTAVASEQSWRNRLCDTQEEVDALSTQLEQSQASKSQLSAQLAQVSQQHEQLLQARVMDESTMLDQLSNAQAELQCLAEELAEARAAQAELSEEATESRQQLADLQEAQTLTEGTLLDQLTDAQSELDGSLVQVRHWEQRHQEVCQQLVIARVGQAETMQAARDVRQSETLSAELEQSKAAFQGVKNQLLTAEAALCDQAASLASFRNTAAASEQSWRDQLCETQKEIEELSRQLEQSQASNSQLNVQLAEASQQVEQVSHAHVIDESTMLDQLSDARAEMQRLAEELAEAQASQAELSEQAAESRQQLADLEEAQTLTEGTLLDQLTDAQTELDGSLIQV